MEREQDLIEESDNWYLIDANKISDLEDIKKIFIALQIGIKDTHPKYETIKHLVTKQSV